MKPDFSGWATKAGLVCADGRTIMPDAFKHQDQMKVPLVWQHGHNDPENVLGHAILTNKPEGVWADGYFNNSPRAQHTHGLLEHGDINMMSIWANDLIERGKRVLHGAIREVSLVLSGANPGATIERVTIRHSDDMLEELEGEAIIYTGLELEHSASADDDEEDNNNDELSHASEGDLTVREVYDSMTEEQQAVLHFMLGAALEGSDAAAAHSNLDKEGITDMTGKRNVFETKGEAGDAGNSLSHDAMKNILENAPKAGTLKAAIAEYGMQHGIDNIELLFPDAVAVNGGSPEWITRQMAWVSGWLSGTRKTPFSRIKSQSADLTFEDARAKGYIKGTLKKEQFFSIAKRTTEPKTVYKKQKLDRDDIVDITDWDVVAGIRQEMRFMLEEEIARAALIGDGRDIADEDKIDETKIRPIATDDEFYVTTVNVQLGDANSNYNEVVDAVITNRSKLRGSGNPNFYTTETHIAKFLTLRDTLGHRIYKTLADLAAELRVNAIIPVEVLEDEPDIIGIIVNPADYTYGATRGGEITTFDDFDIDYNQYKYLIETRLCGALTKYKSAMVVREAAGVNALVTPAMPAFDPETGALTITDQTGVIYKHGATVINNAGSPYTVPAAGTWVVDAVPAAGYAFPTSDDDQWTFTADA